ncbi:hypothetical protein HBE96_19085 [Clostridium sp. P21]|uniref:Uncharacterized protein n=1 Tax=Clostridium muellerianum TaxID=2716538 RepID=A0A7Y0EJV0_9CLOT|nr:hypothetical protein [Clostridium muellerianum]NMM64716.1 hypothetical protein [Clostridium muellerianum]
MIFLYSEILKIDNASIFVTNIKEKSNIVIGVPHHAPSGTIRMPCDSHPYSDENAGYIGDYIAEKLKCSFLCACNYFIDVNKNHNNNYSDYYTALEKCSPKYLVEIHGHGIEHSGNDIEISSGCKEDEKYALELKEKLESIIHKKWSENKEDKDFCKIKDLNINANFNDIYFKATKSSTIVDKRWRSYHIELPVMLRIVLHEKNKLPSYGEKFTEILYEAIKNVCK